jgi:hypothetical protein
LPSPGGFIPNRTAPERLEGAKKTIQDAAKAAAEVPLVFDFQPLITAQLTATQPLITRFTSTAAVAPRELSDAFGQMVAALEDVNKFFMAAKKSLADGNLDALRYRNEIKPELTARLARLTEARQEVGALLDGDARDDSEDVNEDDEDENDETSGYDDDIVDESDVTTGSGSSSSSSSNGGDPDATTDYSKLPTRPETAGVVVPALPTSAFARALLDPTVPRAQRQRIDVADPEVEQDFVEPGEQWKRDKFESKAGETDFVSNFPSPKQLDDAKTMVPLLSDRLMKDVSKADSGAKLSGPRTLMRDLRRIKAKLDLLANEFSTASFASTTLADGPDVPSRNLSFYTAYAKVEREYRDAVRQLGVATAVAGYITAEGAAAKLQQETAARVFRLLWARLGNDAATAIGLAEFALQALYRPLLAARVDTAKFEVGAAPRVTPFTGAESRVTAAREEIPLLNNPTDRERSSVQLGELFDRYQADQRAASTAEEKFNSVAEQVQAIALADSEINEEQFLSLSATLSAARIEALVALAAHFESDRALGLFIDTIALYRGKAINESLESFYEKVLLGEAIIERDLSEL